MRHEFAHQRKKLWVIDHTFEFPWCKQTVILLHFCKIEKARPDPDNIYALSQSPSVENFILLQHQFILLGIFSASREDRTLHLKGLDITGQFIWKYQLKFQGLKTIEINNLTWIPYILVHCDAQQCCRDTMYIYLGTWRPELVIMKAWFHVLWETHCWAHYRWN